MEKSVRRYTALIEPDEDGVYVATVPSVPGVAEQGENVEEALERLKEALAFHLECAEMDGGPSPDGPTTVPARARPNAPDPS